MKRNNQRGWDVHSQKVVKYAYVNEDGSVYRANGYCVGNIEAGDFTIPINEWIEFNVEDGDTSNCPDPKKGTKFLSIEVEVKTPLGIGKGIYNYMDNDWLVEIYGDSSDELQAYKEVTHWRYLSEI